MKRILCLLALLSSPALHCAESPGGRGGPIIDMHLHTAPWEAAEDLSTPEVYSRSWESTQKQLDEAHIVLGLVSGPMNIAAHWQRLAPSRIVAGVMFPCDHGLVPNSLGRKCFAKGESLPDLAWLRSEIKAGRIGFLGEITSQYSGMSPADARLEPYFALAEELDVPVGIHMGLGPWGAIYPKGFCGAQPCAPNYRAAFSNALLLEEVLARHPGLRLWVMHAGWPLKQEMIHLLFSHPQVYVDIAVLGYKSVMSQKVFEDYVCSLVDHGYAKRIMWGSDFPLFRESIASLEAVSCLSAEQKRDILFNNAVTFLKLNTEQRSSGGQRDVRDDATRLVKRSEGTGKQK